MDYRIEPLLSFLSPQWLTLNLTFFSCFSFLARSKPTILARNSFFGIPLRLNVEIRVRELTNLCTNPFLKRYTGGCKKRRKHEVKMYYSFCANEKPKNWDRKEQCKKHRKLSQISPLLAFYPLHLQIWCQKIVTHTSPTTEELLTIDWICTAWTST